MDNTKSVVIRRGQDGKPVWQKDYEQFMKTVGFQAKLCKPHHPFTKGKVERLVRFVKENFLVGRVFWNVTDLNVAALDWRNEQNTAYPRIRTRRTVPMWYPCWMTAMRCCFTYAWSAGFPLTDL